MQIPQRKIFYGLLLLVAVGGLWAALGGHKECEVDYGNFYVADPIENATGEVRHFNNLSSENKRIFKEMKDGAYYSGKGDNPRLNGFPEYVEYNNRTYEFHKGGWRGTPCPTFPS